MNLADLKYFVKTVECRSMNQAARELYITQPALSRGISMLESELNMQLLKRSNQGIQLTSNGKIVYEDAKAILDNIAKVKNKWDSLSETNGQISGEITIVACSFMCKVLINDIFDSFYTKYPNLRLILKESSAYTAFIPFICKSNYNIGISVIASEFMEQIYKDAATHHMQLDILSEDNLVLYLNKNNPIANKETITLNDLHALPLLSTSCNDEFYNHFSFYFSQQYRYQFDSLENCIPLIDKDRAATMLVSKHYQYMRNPNIITRYVEGIDQKYFYYIIYPEDYLLNFSERKILDIIKEHFRSLI